jgi:hypothetical protein
MLRTAKAELGQIYVTKAEPWDDLQWHGRA